jgi:acyl phosphate:glycerol-3-phosphate acyltransferase
VNAFDLAVALAIGYLLGGFPTAALAARARGRRIFDVGSGNMGAMNTARNLGPALGVVVLLVDVGKGALAALAGDAMGAALGAGDETRLALALVAGVAAVAGHAWSPYVGFRGGKALATAFGVALPVTPWGALAALTMIVALLLILRREPPATAITLGVYPLLTYLATMRATLDQDLAFAGTTAALLVALLIGVKHLALRRAQRLAVAVPEDDEVAGDTTVAAGTAGAGDDEHAR